LRGHELIGLNNGDLLLIGGQDPEFNFKTSIWRLSSGTWTLDGYLKKVLLKILVLQCSFVNSCGEMLNNLPLQFR